MHAPSLKLTSGVCLLIALMANSITFYILFQLYYINYSNIYFIISVLN